MLPEMYTAEDVSKWLGISPDAVRKLAKRGQIPCWRNPRSPKQIRFPKNELLGWFAKGKRAPVSETETT